MRRILFSLLVLSLIAVSGVAVSRAIAQAPKPVYVVTHVDFVPSPSGMTEPLSLLKKFAADSLKDAGVLRFEVLQQDSRPNHFMLVEEWRSRADFDAHLTAAHTKQFREKSFPLMGSPYDERLHTLVQ